MDYESIHGKGESNFSSPLSHRLPTVSAAQALQTLKSSPTRCISTGLEQLDVVLQNREAAAVADGETFYGGVSRGKVTEIYGPPGVGKTALCMQLAASTLNAGDGVLWVDTSHPLCGTRLFQILTSFTAKMGHSESTGPSLDPLERLNHIMAPTLAHLIAVLLDPAPGFAADNTSLIVIDAFSTLISSAFPRSTEVSATSKKPGAPVPSSRKFPILQYIINSLRKLAATQNVAIVVVSQCVTKMRPGAGAVLIPSVNTSQWEQGLGSRVALYRDWGWDDEDGKAVYDVRFAQIVKAEGINLPDGRIQPVGFAIDEDGLKSLKFPPVPAFEPSHRTISVINQEETNSALPRKRKLAATDLEIPDSDEEDDEDYGWAEEDEQELPPPPPQWQGSEDILIPPVGQLEAEYEDPDSEGDHNELILHDEGKKTLDASNFINGEIEDSEDELA